MSDPLTLQRFSELSAAGYIPSVGGWIQVAPALGLSTVLNAFNTLGPQTLEIFLMDQAGDPVHSEVRELGRFEALRLDLESVLAEADLPFEGSLWLWSRGAGGEGSIGLQAVDLDFVDRSRPEGYAAGSVHLMFDFFNTLQIPPYLDLVTPRLLAETTPEGSDRFQNYLGLAQVPLVSDAGATLELTVSNELGETMDPVTLSVPMLGSWFGSLEALFPGLPEFLTVGGASRGYGTLTVREITGARNGLVAMLKVVDTVSGEMLVNHLNDRAFARPALKEGD